MVIQKGCKEPNYGLAKENMIMEVKENMKKVRARVNMVMKKARVKAKATSPTERIKANPKLKIGKEANHGMANPTGRPTAGKPPTGAEHEPEAHRKTKLYIAPPT